MRTNTKTDRQTDRQTMRCGDHKRGRRGGSLLQLRPLGSSSTVAAMSTYNNTIHEEFGGVTTSNISYY